MSETLADMKRRYGMALAALGVTDINDITQKSIAITDLAGMAGMLIKSQPDVGGSHDAFLSLAMKAMRAHVKGHSFDATVLKFAPEPPT